MTGHGTTSFRGRLDCLIASVRGLIIIESAHMLSYLWVAYGLLTQFLEPSPLGVLSVVRGARSTGWSRPWPMISIGLVVYLSAACRSWIGARLFLSQW